MAPDSTRKQLVNIRKTQETLKKNKKKNKQETEEESDEDEKEAFGRQPER